MKLTKAQIEHIKTKRKELERAIALEPKYGLFTLHSELNTMNVIVQLHNAEIEAEKQRKAQIATLRKEAKERPNDYSI